MKPFDLEAAKRGDPVQTKVGYPVRIVCFDMKIDASRTGLVALISKPSRDYEIVITYDPDRYDELVMAPVKRTREVWINVYPTSTALYHSEEDADLIASKDRIALEDRLACIPVTLEWEE